MDLENLRENIKILDDLAVSDETVTVTTEKGNA